MDNQQNYLNGALKEYAVISNRTQVLNLQYSLKMCRVIIMTTIQARLSKIMLPVCIIG